MNHESTELPPELDALLALDSADGPAHDISPAASQAIVGQALDAWAAERIMAPPPRSRTRLGRRGAFVAALTLGASVAAAHFVTNAGWFARQDSTTQVEPGATTASPTPLQPARQVAEQTEPIGQPKAGHVAQDLLAKANAQRGAGAYSEATATYLAAAAQAPNAEVAQVAQVAAADLKLDRLGAPDEALSLYREAARTAGPLSPEAHMGMARALRALGDSAGEQRALKTLRRTYPDSAGAQWAGDRLKSIQDTPR